MTIDAPIATPIAPDATGFLDLTGQQYQLVLREIHLRARPATYLEIGTKKGGSLRMSRCASVAIDPNFTVDINVMRAKPMLALYQMTSDDYFDRFDPQALLGGPVQLAFLDGMHKFDFLLRDFMNTERHCRPDSVIVLDDCLPCDPWITAPDIHDTLREKSRFPRWWAGDVWKMVPVLRKYRPDLRIHVTDARNTGLVFVSDLDPGNSILTECYDEILRDWEHLMLAEYGFDRYVAECAVEPVASLIAGAGFRRLFPWAPADAA